MARMDEATAKVTLQMVDMMIDSRMYKEAIDMCDVVLFQLPENALALELKGVCLLEMKRFAEALPVCRSALLYAPSVPRVRYNLALALEETDHKKAALAEYDEALKLDADFAEPRVRRASLRGELGDEAGAMADLDEFVRRNPDMPRAYFLRGGWNATRRRFKEALPDLKKALAMDPSLEPELDALAKQLGFPID